jgi:hypothetical protein
LRTCNGERFLGFYASKIVGVFWEGLSFDHIFDKDILKPN